MSGGCRGGERSVGVRANNAYAPDAGSFVSRSETRPSLGPSTRARRSSLRTAGAIPGGEALEVASRLGKPAQAGGTSTGAIANGRSAARRAPPLPQGRGRGAIEKDGGRGLPPCEDARARVWLLARRSLLQKSVGDVWSRISPANALQKGRQGRVNGGLAPRSRRWVKPSARAWGERTNRASTFTAQKRERIGARLRVARDRHSAVAPSLTR